MTKRNRPSGQKLTADTITDEQIREIWEREEIGPDVYTIAIGARSDVTRHDYRARCAEILNARKERPNAD